MDVGCVRAAQVPICLVQTSCLVVSQGTDRVIDTDQIRDTNPDSDMAAEEKEDARRNVVEIGMDRGLAERK